MSTPFHHPLMQCITILFDLCLFLSKKKKIFIYGCAGSSFLCELFSSYGEWGYSPVAVHGLLIAVASLVAEHEL